MRNNDRLKLSPEALAKRVGKFNLKGSALKNARFAYQKALEFGDPDPIGFVAQGYAESRFNPNAVSRVGARGVWQFMPKTARGFKLKNPHDVATSTQAALKYRKSLRNDKRQPYKSENLVYAGYNAGLGAVLKYKGIPPYKETVQYVQKINAYKGKVAEALGVENNNVLVPETPIKTSSPISDTLASGGYIGGDFKPLKQPENRRQSLGEVANFHKTFQRDLERSILG